MFWNQITHILQGWGAVKSNFLKRHFTKIEGPAPGPGPPPPLLAPQSLTHTFFFFSSFFKLMLHLTCSSSSIQSLTCVHCFPPSSLPTGPGICGSGGQVPEKWGLEWFQRQLQPTCLWVKGGSLMNTCFSQNNYVSWKILVLLLFCPFFPFSLEQGEAKGIFFSLSGAGWLSPMDNEQNLFLFFSKHLSTILCSIADLWEWMSDYISDM